MSEDAEAPLQVVKGEPTAEELAALVAVVSAKAAEASNAEPERPSSWAAYWRLARTPLQPGPGAWRTSALPR